MSAPRLSIMPGWVFTDDRFKPMDIKILGMLGRHIDKGGWCTRSQVKLAREMGIARSTVQASLTRLCDIGVVQKRQNQTADGRDCSHDWRVLLDVEPEDLKPLNVADDEPENRAAPPCRYTGTPAAISAPPADPMDRHPLPILGPAPYKNDPLITTPQKRERERASADATGNCREGVESEQADEPLSASKPDPATAPGTAAFRKRVVWFCSGRGFAAGAWPNWDAERSASIEWVTDRFAELSEQDRQLAEQWRDAYLRDIATRGLNPQKVGIFVRDRMWEGLDPELLLKAQRAAVQGAKPAEHAKPDGWAVARGPVWSAALHQVLLNGPDHPDLAPDSGLWLAGDLRRAWPRLSGLRQMADMGRGFVAPQQLHRLKGAMEFVPADCEVWQAWEGEYKARGWPMWPRHDGMKGMYFPKGGPDGLAAFEAQLTSHKETAA